MTRISTIITTYNRPEHLRRCLASLERQTLLPDEVIVADDGSDLEHVPALEEVVRESALAPRLVRQEHRGFRAAANRNNGARAASGDLLLFLDGDIVLFPEAVERHAEACAGRFWTAGGVVPLSAEETRLLTLEQIRAGLDALWPPADDPRVAVLARRDAKFRGRAAQRWLRLSEARMRSVRLITLQCAVPRRAFEHVNGFDERYVGWGREDHDLSLRLQIAGVRGRSVIAAARAFHQWHPRAPIPEHDEDEVRPSVNDAYYERRRWWRYRCREGLR